LFAAAEREKSLVGSSGCFRQSGHWTNWNLARPRWEKPFRPGRGNDRRNHLADRLEPYTTSTSLNIRKTMVRQISIGPRLRGSMIKYATPIKNQITKNAPNPIALMPISLRTLAAESGQRRQAKTVRN
jgi:hypothetical protein